MADAVSSQTILDGERLFIGKFTNISDGTGEVAVNKIVAASLAPNAFGRACNGLKINKIWQSTNGMQVRILFDASVDSFAWMLTQPSTYFMDFSPFGGLSTNAGAGSTGNIRIYYARCKHGDTYTVVLECIKTYATA